MQKTTDYQDLSGEIYQFLESRIRTANASGIDKSQIIVDPGIGFAKTYNKTWKFSRLPMFRSLKLPYFSRAILKKFYWSHFESTRPESTSLGTAAACCAAIAADILRGSRCQANVRRLPRC